jgi:hypothetical protein
VISLNLVLAGLRLGLKNRQMGEALTVIPLDDISMDKDLVAPIMPAFVAE